MSKYRADLTEKAKRRRQEPVAGERWVWQELRKFRPAGLVFRREHPFGPYILDFYCPKLKLAIEIDGVSHDDQRDRDQDRQSWLESNGLTVLRFPSPRSSEEASEIAKIVERHCLAMGWEPTNSPDQT